MMRGSSGDPILNAMVDLRAAKQPFALATVIDTRGSVSAKPGSKAVIGQNGRIVTGWVGGGCAENSVCHTALDCLRMGDTAVIELDMNDEVLGTGMPCGGSMRVYVEPFLPAPTLWLLGHGRVAECVCSLGALMGFEVVVDDPLADSEHYPDAVRLLTDDMDYGQLTPEPADFVVIATQHKGDHQSLQRALRSGASRIALIASRKRARLVMDYLRSEGFDATDLQRVSAPAGFDLGARSPDEIALSVVCELVMQRRGGSGLLLRDKISQPEGADPSA